MTVRNSEAEYTGQPLKGLSFDRLTCLLRHWAWADEARQRFERELAAFPDDSTPGSAGNPDRILGAYYHWCAMLCALGDAAEGDALIDYASDDILGAYIKWPFRDGLFGIKASFYRQGQRKADIDNLLKTVSDAATGIFWADDSQVREQYGRVEYGSSDPRVEIEIYLLDGG